MTDLRQDPVTGRWVIIAENRAKRPVEFQRTLTRRTTVRCPFCAGNEKDTPQAIADYRLSNGTDPSPWQVRVVPNKYPAVNGSQQATLPAVSLFTQMQPAGVHEVIIESPNHLLSVSELSDEQCRLIYSVYRDRLRDLSGHSQLSYALVFRNAGAAAGASLEHLHSQLIALPMIPSEVQIELGNSERFFRDRGHCVFCSIVDSELQASQRVIAQSARFIALCPFASRFSFETWILPRWHASCFEETSDEDLWQLSDLVREMIRRVEAALDHPAYNVLLRTSPFDSSLNSHYHWRVEILPRLTEIAGFEFGTGCYLNCTSPEAAAATLREIA